MRASTEALNEAERVTKREIRHSHYAQPELVENLLLALEVGSLAISHSSLSIDPVLNLIQFAKKKKWLCAWGPELIDETHRLSNTVLPICIEHKKTDLYRQYDREEEFEISGDEVVDYLSDEKQQWDRIILREIDDEIFELLHLHPCEELHLDFELGELEREDFAQIAKCKDLRLLDLYCNRYDPEDIRLLEPLPHLEKIIYGLSDEAFTCLDALQRFPHLTMLQMNASNEADPEDPEYPFEDFCLTDALSYIRERAETTRHLHISITVGPIAFATIGQFKHVESIFIADICALSYTGFDLYLLFMSPSIQQSVRHLHFNCIKFDKEALSYLAKFKNLRTIDFRGLGVSTRHVCRIIHTNADHLRTLIVSDCSKVRHGLLEAIASCKSLRDIDISGTGVTKEAIEKYKEAKRPFWQVISYRPPRHPPKADACSSESSDEDAEGRSSQNANE